MTQGTTGTSESRTVVDRAGQKIGKLDSLYRDQDGGQLEWALVNTGLFGSKSSFVLLRGATLRQDDVRVAFDKDTVKNAPRIDTGGELTPDEERRLFDHYGVAYDQDEAARATGDTSRAGSDRWSEPGSDEAMTRSEEELRVGTESRERGRARLRKHVVTEHQQATVPVRREEVHIEREPIDDTNRDAATSGPSISEDEHAMTLHEERPVTDTEVVPKERVRMSKNVETEHETVDADLRKERIDTDDDLDSRNR